MGTDQTKFKTQALITTTWASVPNFFHHTTIYLQISQGCKQNQEWWLWRFLVLSMLRVHGGQQMGVECQCFPWGIPLQTKSLRIYVSGRGKANWISGRSAESHVLNLWARGSGPGKQEEEVLMFQRCFHLSKACTAFLIKSIKNKLNSGGTELSMVTFFMTKNWHQSEM